MLKVADPEHPFILQTDACEYSLGVMLSQEDEMVRNTLSCVLAVSSF